MNSVMNSNYVTIERPRSYPETGRLRRVAVREELASLCSAFPCGRARARAYGEGKISYACLAALGSNPRFFILTNKTVREGFEPSVGFKAYGALAKLCFRPLSHLT